ncbi:transcription-repair coupling factor [Paenibacillus lactis]|uniref:Transcription-repair-coupling factor n=1 Tax=Paenibacillus lactis TaxID=228574 RepID=A0ABS4FJW3_9BACL|nr:transcription-repair coupling factor [Paenibacillus lactis]MBP1896549.1 transcription-repair coupling factor (superfamily II helicase) [Paenibacillus lactis]MCM3497530.1 transcription-repair coupling factor [Paenibacillus lactis]HAF99037.1 transcription-repair coupling factor [Paenibacillus lactis]
MLQALIDVFSKDSDFKSIAAGVGTGMREQLISGLSGSSRQILMAALHQDQQRPLLVVTHNMFSAQKIADDLQEALSPDQVLLYPANELVAAESAVSSPETLAQRIDVLVRCARGFRGIVVAPFSGVRRLLPAPEVMADARITLQDGGTLELDAFLNRMIEMGYERVERVESRGEMSVRGGIIDFYPMTAAMAYRVELFDEDIDSIRTFDPADQRSIDKVREVVITPCKEIIADSERLNRTAETVTRMLEAQLERMTDRQAKLRLREEIHREVELLRERIYFPEIYKYISLLYPEKTHLYDYMPKDTILVLDEPARLLETAKQLERDEAEWNLHLLQHGKSLPDLPLSLDTEELIYQHPYQCLLISIFLRQVPRMQPQNIVNFITRGMQDFHGQMNVLKSEMDRWKKSGVQVMMLAGDAERMERMRRVLNDYGIDEPLMFEGHLQNGFEMPSVHAAVITESEMFSSKQRKTRKTTKSMDNAERIKSYTELKVGDYVVHQNHGIGKYMGIGTLEINGIHKDYMHILYAGGDKLSVPIEQIDLIQKYVGSEDKEPKIYKLGGNEWTRVKNKVRSSVQDIADDLIKLYAERQSAPGYGFDKDTPEQQEFEDMFPYDETPDQLRAIAEIKKDMEQNRPMDRLLCGDVGYGKTEVAVRAAFKAAIEGKQVAVLVPTTILAQQHYETFRERFANYPINIQVLSRFRSRKEQNETIKKVKQGAVDILIGTHRLLSQDIVFKDLGLLIVDEEQRFGVTHKEKLKKLKTNVDVLTLTATPIPRTLHMSMLGVRDLSVIETPPENRFPVQTYVVEHSQTLVREAIERELARGGQVYYLYNRVQGIHEMAAQISMLVPEARVGVGHGQMSETELEKTILDFLDGEYDVLVSTSIIETGVDIPNVNTLIVHDADKMGLSQLYQLRGRVGRSNRIAYAYFTYQRDKVLTEVAEKRLQSIKEFTELGSGFKIAMRDLSIRGAGNLLGAEQHGFIASVGFDLYSQMLAEEIQKRKVSMLGETAAPTKDWNTSIDLGIDAYLPSDYIYDSIQKIEIYKKVASVTTIDESAELEDELLDRFGELPQAVNNLLAVSRLKVYGRTYGIDSITQRGDDVLLQFYEGQDKAVNTAALAQIGNLFERRVQFEQGPAMVIRIKGKGLDDQQLLELLEKFLEAAKEPFNLKGELHNAVKK